MVGDDHYRGLAEAGRRGADAVEQSFPAWAEIAAERVEQKVGPLPPDERADLLRELERRLRSDWLDRQQRIMDLADRIPLANARQR